MDKINFRKVFVIILLFAYQVAICFGVPAESFTLKDLACVILTIYIIHYSAEV